jgi:hypothetical protein
MSNVNDNTTLDGPSFGNLGGLLWGSVGPTGHTFGGVGKDEQPLGWLKTDGTIVSWNGTDQAKQIGLVKLDGSVVTVVNSEEPGKFSAAGPWNDAHPGTKLKDITNAGIVTGATANDPTVVGVVISSINTISNTSQMKIFVGENEQVSWVVLRDDCDVSKDRLRHSTAAV